MKTNYFRGLLQKTAALFALVAVSAGATTYTLTTVTQGSGSITNNPTFAAYPSGGTVALAAIPATGWYFDHWSGDASGSVNPVNVTMTGNLVVTGTFLAYPNYTLVLGTNGQGSVVVDPAGGSYQSNTVVNVTATAASGWVFTGWSGAASGSVNPLALTLNTNLALTGNFAQLPAFDQQPVGVTALSGSTVSFSAHAVGTDPVSYQWYFSGGTLSNPSASTSTLLLTNAGSSQAGTYWAVATNNYGSATSAVVALVLTNAAGPTNVVNTADEGSLRAAIAQGGWVGLNFNGTITLTNTIAISNSVVLDGSQVSAVLSGGNALRLFYVASGASLTLSNLTLANGACLITSTAQGTNADGGAIYLDGGTAVLAGCTLTNNHAQSQIYASTTRGGAIFNNGGTLALYQSLVVSNSAIGGGFLGVPFAPTYSAFVTTNFALGGAIYNNNGTVLVSGCTLNGNFTEALVAGGGTYYIDSSHIAHSVYTEAHAVAIGGAVYQDSGSLTVTGSAFALNTVLGGNAYAYSLLNPPGPAGAAYGGALAAKAGTVAVDASQFSGNNATGGDVVGAYNSTMSGPAYGGAIYSTASLFVHNSSLTGNQSTAGTTQVAQSANAYGGGVYNFGTASLDGCLLASNVVRGGKSVHQTTTSGSAGTGAGGGAGNAGQLSATNCTVAFNLAFGGDGDVYANGIEPNGNAVGGGIFNNTNATFAGMNLTIASNSCAQPPHSYMYYTDGQNIGLQVANTNGGVLRLHNTLVAGTNSNAYGTITDDGYNICSDSSAGFASGKSFNSTDPGLAWLGNYGGPTLCMGLQSTSPAIDFADPASYPAVDQRGYPRPAGSAADMGAFEYGATAPAAVAAYPRLTLAAKANQLQLSFAATPTNTYYLQMSTNLINWVDVSTNGPLGVVTNFNQTVNPASNGHAFFRIRVQ